MATGKALDGKPYAGNPHVRFDEGHVTRKNAFAGGNGESTMHITKRLFLAAAMAAGLVGSAPAADLDLNGVDRTVTGIAEFSGTDGGVIVGDHMRVWKDCE